MLFAAVLLVCVTNADAKTECQLASPQAGRFQSRVQCMAELEDAAPGLTLKWQGLEPRWQFIRVLDCVRKADA